RGGTSPQPRSGSVAPRSSSLRSAVNPTFGAGLAQAATTVPASPRRRRTCSAACIRIVGVTPRTRSSALLRLGGCEGCARRCRLVLPTLGLGTWLAPSPGLTLSPVDPGGWCSAGLRAAPATSPTSSDSPQAWVMRSPLNRMTRADGSCLATRSPTTAPGGLNPSTPSRFGSSSTLSAAMTSCGVGSGGWSVSRVAATFRLRSVLGGVAGDHPGGRHLGGRVRVLGDCESSCRGAGRGPDVHARRCQRFPYGYRSPTGVGGHDRGHHRHGRGYLRVDPCRRW